jgi:hypothetical protein
MLSSYILLVSRTAATRLTHRNHGRLADCINHQVPRYAQQKQSPALAELTTSHQVGRSPTLPRWLGFRPTDEHVVGWRHRDLGRGWPANPVNESVLSITSWGGSGETATRPKLGTEVEEKQMKCGSDPFCLQYNRSIDQKKCLSPGENSLTYICNVECLCSVPLGTIPSVSPHF